jgi:Flp pilus assembly protein TadD
MVALPFTGRCEKTPRGARTRALLALAFAATLLFGAPAFAAPPTDDEVAKAEQDQDKALAEAQRAGSMARVVPTYESRFGRQPTLLNRYLYARALFHAGDKAGALREMRALVKQEDAFWHAHVRIAHLLLDEKNAALARPHLDRARSLRPDAVYVLRVSVELGITTQDWDLALKSLQRLAQLQPGDEQVQVALAEVHRERGDWKSAHATFRPLRLAHPDDRRLRYAYAYAAFRAGLLDESAAEFEELTKADPRAAAPYLQPLLSIYLAKAEASAKKGATPDLAALERTLDRMAPFLDLSKPDKKNVLYLVARREVLFQKQDWKGLVPVLKALLAFAEPAQRAEQERVIAALEAGQTPGAMAAGAAAPEPTDEDVLMALVERCLAPDVKTRRAALQQFYEAKVGWVPKAILLHFHPTEEPDPECRAWVLKLVGLLQDAGHAKIAGHALQDPASRVRRVASEVLGEVGTPAGVLYLVARMPDMPLAADASEDVVAEYNAARLALVALTGFDDVPIGAPRWIPASGLVASWAAWRTWLASPDGVRMKLRAIEDLVRTGESHPEWYLLLMVWDPSPEVAKAAYDVLLVRSSQPSDDAVAKKFWPTFPRLTTKAGERELTLEESIADVKARIQTWWEGWLSARRGESEAPPAPAKPGVKPAPQGGGKPAPGGAGK